MKMLLFKRDSLFCCFIFIGLSSHIIVSQDTDTILLYADMNSIKLLDIQRGNQIEIVSGQTNIVAIDFHTTKNYIYWCDTAAGRVLRLHFPVSFDDTAVEEVISPMDSPRSIAVDSLYDHLYWTKSEGESGGQIMRSELNGSISTVVINLQSGPIRALTLDIEDGWIYYESGFSQTGTLERCHLDGSNQQTIVSNGVDYIALDLFHDRVYWCGAFPFVIQSAFKNGSDVQHIVTGQSYMTTDIGYESIYFSDQQRGIYQMPKDNSSLPTLIYQQNQNQIYGMKVYRRYSGVIRLWNISSSGDLKENGTGTFTCSATFVGNIENATISWRLNNATINPTTNSRWKIETLPQDPQIPSSITYQLTVNPVLLRDTGTMSCHIQYEDLLYERKLEVTVSELPVVSITPRRAIVNRGDTVNIECRIMGAPTEVPTSTTHNSLFLQQDLETFRDSTIVWYKNGFPLETRQADCNNGVFDRLTVTDIQNSSVYECAGQRMVEPHSSVGKSIGMGRKVSSIITVLQTNVNYKFCREYTDANNITWNSTVENVMVETPCPGRSTGTVTRLCNSQGNWEEPDYSSCIKEDFLILHNKTEIIKDGIEESDVNVLLGSLDNLLTENENDLTSGDLEVSSSILNNLVDYISERTHTLSSNQIEVVVNVTNNLLEDRNSKIWDQLKRLNLNGITRVVKSLTTYTKVYASGRPDEFNSYLKRDNLVVAVGRTTSNEVIFPDRSQEQPTWLTNSTTKVKLNTKSLSNTGLKPVEYSGIYYRNISRLFHNRIISNGSLDSIEGISEVNSVVVNFWISASPRKLSPRKLDSDLPLVVEFQHLNESLSNPVCVFWNFNVSDSPYGAWSTVGSRLLKSTNMITTCGYDHTTNFAILMSPGNTPSKHLLALSILSIFGCGMSILCLIITVVVYVYLWRYVKSDRSVILVNLCVSLALSYILFLIGATRTENENVCTIFAVVLHYIFLVDFALMLTEGIEVGFSILLVFKSEPKAKWLVPISWFIPAVIVGISAGVTKLQGYGNKDNCWLSFDSGLLWAFVGPALLVIVVNIVILVLVLKAMFSSRAMLSKTSKEKGTAGIRSMFVILPLFGITWVLGIFSINEDLVIFQYLFAIANSLQGFMIFIFHCFLNKRIREGIQHIKRRRSSQYIDSKVTSQSQSKMENSSTTQTFDNELYVNEKTFDNELYVNEKDVKELHGDGESTQDEIPDTNSC